MGRVKLRPDLNTVVARMAAPHVTNVARATEALAKRNAPATKEWETVRDGRVRHSHLGVDRTVLPDNLRFTLQAFEWDVQNPRPGGVTEGLQRGMPYGDGWAGVEARYAASSSYLLEPRDRTGEHLVQIINCRCRILVDPLGVARMVHRSPTLVMGTKVKATVYAQGEYVIGAEYGDTYTLPSGPKREDGTYFMRNTAATMKARMMAR